MSPSSRSRVGWVASVARVKNKAARSFRDRTTNAFCSFVPLRVLKPRARDLLPRNLPRSRVMIIFFTCRALLHLPSVVGRHWMSHPPVFVSSVCTSTQNMVGPQGTKKTLPVHAGQFSLSLTPVCGCRWPFGLLAY